MVADVRLVEPATVVTHEVVHPAVLGSRLKEGERAVEIRRPDLLLAALCKRERDDRQPGDVVDAVAAAAVGNDSVRVLHDADIVGECEQMVGPQARQVQVGDAGGPSSAAQARRLPARREPVASATAGQASVEPIRRASVRAASSVSGCSM